MDLAIEIVKAVLQPLVIFALICLAFLLLKRHRTSLREIMLAAGVRKFGLLGFTAEFIEEELSAASQDPESQKEEGARLPVSDADRPEIQCITERLGPAAAGGRILWFDFKPSNNRYERAAFTRLGIDVQTRRTKEEAMTELGDSKERYDLIISNWGQRDKRQGMQLLEEVRQKDLRPKLPFLFYTGQDRLADKQREASEKGAQGVTASRVELYRWVLKLLAAREDRGTTSRAPSAAGP
jgi:CheY-like chemotaxis protein